MSHMGPRGATYALAALFALALACDLLWMPIQVSDSLGEILEARQSPSVWASFTDTLGSEAYLRPLRIAQIKALFDLAEGRHYWAVYRGFHALLIVAAILLFTRALRVRTAMDFAAAAVALVVLIGLHTFRGTVQEAFPINHFLEIVGPVSGRAEPRAIARWNLGGRRRRADVRGRGVDARVRPLGVVCRRSRRGPSAGAESRCAACP